MHRICMVGTGYVGLVSGACFADFGNQVTCVDLDESKIAQLERGEIPFFEPGLDELVDRNCREGRLRFTTDLVKAIQDNEVLFICVGTPRGPDGEADLQYVDAVARDVGRHMTGYRLIVQKSTVPVGSGKRIHAIIAGENHDGHGFDVASNPEFLREGSAIEDFMRPNRVVIGTWTERAENILAEIYKPLYLNEAPLVRTRVETAELIKYASNAFLATKISFINEIANLCELVGADVKEVARAMGLDRRIGSKFLHAGAGYGGSCFPKDTEALAHTGRALGYPLRIVQATIDVNEDQRTRLLERIEREIGGFKGKHVAILGLSFKPQTDDVRDAVPIDFARIMHAKGAKVTAFDPKAIESARRAVPEIIYSADIWSAVEGADATVIATEWNEFRHMDLGKIRTLMKGDFLADLRNIYEPEAIEKLGFRYMGVGRGYLGQPAGADRS